MKRLCGDFEGRKGEGRVQDQVVRVCLGGRLSWSLRRLPLRCARPTLSGRHCRTVLGRSSAVVARRAQLYRPLSPAQKP